MFFWLPSIFPIYIITLQSYCLNNFKVIERYDEPKKKKEIAVQKLNFSLIFIKQTVQTLASRRRRGRRAVNDLEGRLVVKANAEWEASVDRAASRAAALDQTANRRECGPY